MNHRFDTGMKVRLKRGERLQPAYSEPLEGKSFTVDEWIGHADYLELVEFPEASFTGSDFEPLPEPIDNLIETVVG